MGIKGLWTALARVAVISSFKELITAEALERRLNGDELPIIGVDASPLMFAAKFATKKKGESINSWTRIGRETELANLRKNLEQWLTLPAIVLVVFDGPRRPKMKRGKQVRTSRPHQLEPAFREMVEAMGFYCETAPGEAEAHLAMLNQSGAVDYILTSDNDAFVFGARNVIRL
ncbi:PIN domain-like protein [Ephemerocybe angulata]|uniref:PIN domain-like protein n=1 Tax=Ephemerocybe angulata TaxID=980116 RepID=A0A8H6HYW0_9AGAR|nr:PIN domain-like protein [Tulosesus angulatus]